MPVRPPVIRTKEHAIAEAAGDLRIIAQRLEEYVNDHDRVSMLPPAFPSPPPRPSIIDSLRVKRFSLPATGAWVAVATLIVEVLRDLLRVYVQNGGH